MSTNIISRSCTFFNTSTQAKLLAMLQQKSSFHMTSVLESKKAGRHKMTPKRDKSLTYEEAQKPHLIGVTKSFNSINTNSLIDSIRPAEAAQEDLLIRKLVHGIWPKLLTSDVIIKRRANQIIICFMAVRAVTPAKFYFLIGYTEELLSYVLKCIVKVELQTIEEASDLHYKYV